MIHSDKLIARQPVEVVDCYKTIPFKMNITIKNSNYNFIITLVFQWKTYLDRKTKLEQFQSSKILGKTNFFYKPAYSPINFNYKLCLVTAKYANYSRANKKTDCD